MQAASIYGRASFAWGLIGACAVLGCLCFLVLDRIAPFDEIDRVYYFTLYLGIGAVTGAGAAYFARLISRRSATFFNIAALLLPAYFFVTLLGMDKNPPVVAVVTVSVLIILLTAALAARSARAA